MRNNSIINKLKDHVSELKKYSVRTMALFGSSLNKDIEDASDIDLLIELEKETFDNYMDLKIYLENLFGKKVDLALTDTLKPRIKNNILKDIEYVPGL